MNKNKLIVLVVLLIAVVGLTMGAVSAGSTTSKSKYKIVKVGVKSKVTSKKAGKYNIAAQKLKYNKKNYIVVVAFGKKKAYKANKYESRIYFKLNNKKYYTKWSKGDGTKQKKLTYQYYLVPKKIKVKKVAVRYKK